MEYWLALLLVYISTSSYTYLTSKENNMIDYSKIKEHELKMLTNQEGYMKFAKAFFDSQFGISSPFTEEEFHQAIEYQKELVKRNIEESDFSKEIKEQKKRIIDASYSVIEEYLKNYYFVRIQ